MQSSLMVSLNYITKQFPGFQFDEFNEKTILDWESPEIFIVETRNFLPVHMEKLGSFLSRNEIIRCLRFHSQRDRESFIVVHGLLRYFIGRYLDIHPSTVSLEYNRFGKPLLAGHYKSLFFNLSHSADISMLAFDNKRSIGIDVEKIDPEIDFQSISKTFFTAKEYEYINPGEEGDLRRFYQLWTRKEALLKALGIGISQNLDIEVYRRKHQLQIEGQDLLKMRDDNYSLRTMTYVERYMITSATMGDSGEPVIHLMRSEKPDYLLNLK
jgi:phosphopantetheine--protein transferase-like protein